MYTKEAIYAKINSWWQENLLSINTFSNFVIVFKMVHKLLWDKYVDICFSIMHMEFHALYSNIFKSKRILS